MAESALVGLALSALRSAAPLLLVLLGECLTQRVGRINLGVEGQMLVGAVAGYGITAISGEPWLGMAAGSVAGGVLSLVYAGLTVAAEADVFASGLAVWMLGYGASAYFGSGLVGLRIGGFSTGFAGLTPTTWLALALVPVIALWLNRTRTGLVWRAVGESPAAARAAGITPWKVIVAGIAVGGLLSGLGGAALSVDHTRTWAEGMTAGRGFIAVGLVIVARWNPWLALPAAFLFGLAEAFSLRLQADGSAVPAHLLHTLPYVVSLAVFAVTCARSKGGGGPEALRAAFAR